MVIQAALSTTVDAPRSAFKKEPRAFDCRNNFFQGVNAGCNYEENRRSIQTSTQAVVPIRSTDSHQTCIYVLLELFNVVAVVATVFRRDFVMGLISCTATAVKKTSYHVLIVMETIISAGVRMVTLVAGTKIVLAAVLPFR